MPDKKSRRDTPPDDGEWPDVWDAVDRANMAWMIVAPIHAIVSNWKAIVVIAGVVVWINSPAIVGALSTLLGVSP